MGDVKDSIKFKDCFFIDDEKRCTRGQNVILPTTIKRKNIVPLLFTLTYQIRHYGKFIRKRRNHLHRRFSFEGSTVQFSRKCFLEF